MKIIFTAVLGYLPSNLQRLRLQTQIRIRNEGTWVELKLVIVAIVSDFCFIVHHCFLLFLIAAKDNGIIHIYDHTAWHLNIIIYLNSDITETTEKMKQSPTMKLGENW